MSLLWVSKVCLGIFGVGNDFSRGKSPNMGRYIISYQEVLRCLLKNVNDQAHEAVLCDQSINDQLLRTSVLTGCLCFGAL
jgi:hypothetical protein